MSKGYVLYFCEHMRDGQEAGAKVFDTIEEAIGLANKLRNGFAGDNYTIRLFELGQEIPLTLQEETEPQPPKVVRKYFTAVGPKVRKRKT